MYFFDASTFLFYDDSERHLYESSNTWPDGMTEVSDSVFTAYAMSTPPDGKMRGADADGMPIWVDIPAPVLTYAQELATLNTAYSADRLELCQAWLVAAVADGVAETERKADVEAELDELDAQHAADIAELKTKYGVS